MNSGETLLQTGGALATLLAVLIYILIIARIENIVMGHRGQKRENTEVQVHGREQQGPLGAARNAELARLPDVGEHRPELIRRLERLWDWREQEGATTVLTHQTLRLQQACTETVHETAELWAALPPEQRDPARLWSALDQLERSCRPQALGGSQAARKFSAQERYLGGLPAPTLNDER